jgi:hypothetical protein
VAAAARRIFSAVTVPPVNDTRGTLGWDTRLEPARPPNPNTMFTTPVGTPEKKKKTKTKTKTKKKKKQFVK